MRELLRVGALLFLLGVMLTVAAALIQAMGLQAEDISSPATALQAGAGNALLLLMGFGGTGLIYFLLFEREKGRILLQSLGLELKLYGWIALFMAGLFFILPWLSLDAESFRLPSSWSHWEKLLEQQEAQIEALMRALITYGALPALLVFLAVAPALAEEFFFRGALQTQLGRMLPSHATVWITAVIFSLIHFQVYGLLPRALLGAVMGYLTLYTKSLWPAIWAHFLNNAYATLVAFAGLHYFGRPEWIESSYRPPFWTALIGAALAGMAGYRLYQQLRRA